ncbi:hypothetical protein AB6A40_000797 [Gnathostoma spinigerum]|uniref:Uncharacterized protein n=1 Tax=Gnathostoma spinigerum TaxID=75299 RepID=A0ABD6E2W6_9BILA
MISTAAFICAKPDYKSFHPSGRLNDGVQSDRLQARFASLMKMFRPNTGGDPFSDHFLGRKLIDIGD